jgi:hypothetical protein
LTYNGKNERIERFMNKEKLKEFGLTEEQADKVMGVLDGAFVPKSRFDEVNTEKNQLKASVTERDAQLLAETKALELSGGLSGVDSRLRLIAREGESVKQIIHNKTGLRKNLKKHLTSKSPSSIIVARILNRLFWGGFILWRAL